MFTVWTQSKIREAENNSDYALSWLYVAQNFTASATTAKKFAGLTAKYERWREITVAIFFRSSETLVSTYKPPRRDNPEPSEPQIP